MDDTDDSRVAEALNVLTAKSCPFSDLGTELLKHLLSALQPREYVAGEHLIRQGEPGDHLLLILSGTAEAFIRHAASNHTTVGEFRAGDVVGEISLLTGEARTADVVSRTPVRALLLSVGDFHKVADTHPEVRMVLTNVVADRLGKATYDGLGGKDIHGYRIVRCVGRGGMGIVYEAIQLSTGDRVALKMLNHRLLYHPDAVQRFRREAETLALLQHDSIARLYDTFSAYSTQFLVMEYCEGSTLKELIVGGRCLDEHVVRGIIGQLAITLRYVHRHGLIHRDLKPSNIVVSGSGAVKLLDFGLVKSDPTWPDGKGPEGRTVSYSAGFHGTLPYMAPEQFGREAVDHRVDLYGLACTAYEALAGRPVFDAQDLLGIIQQKLRFVLPERQQIGPGVSIEMHEFLALGLEPHADKRTFDLSRLAAWAVPANLGGPPRGADMLGFVAMVAVVGCCSG